MKLPRVDVHDNGQMCHVLLRTPGDPARFFESTEAALRAADFYENYGAPDLANEIRVVAVEVRNQNAVRCARSISHP